MLRKILLVSSDGPTAQTWCETTSCPSAATATADNCCVHHVNVHSCPKAKTSFCGPWIPHDGQVFTHSEVLVGPVQTGNWTSYVPGFYESGLTSLIAHFKVADMHYALETEINVVPKSGELERFQEKLVIKIVRRGDLLEKFKKVLQIIF